MKETFYFSHDYNARNDPKMLELRSEYGLAGVGVYWCLVETLAESPTGHVNPSLIGGLSAGFGMIKKELLEVIEFMLKIELLLEDESGYYSKRMMDHKNFRKMLSQKGKEGARARWAGGAKDSPPISPPISPPNAKERKGKENKVKEIKENKDIDLIKNEISKLSNNYAEENFRAFEKWRDYLEKQHNNFLKENIYTYQILQNAIKSIGASKFVQAVNFSIESNYKKIYPRPEAREQKRVTAQAAKKDSDF